MKVCAEPGCPRLQTQDRCLEHRRQRERSRGTKQQRGYDRDHVKLRADYQQQMNAGQRYSCWRCGTPINPKSWHLGHDDHDRSKHRGPECVPCNTSAPRRISPGA